MAISTYIYISSVWPSSEWVFDACSSMQFSRSFCRAKLYCQVTFQKQRVSNTKYIFINWSKHIDEVGCGSCRTGCASHNISTGCCVFFFSLFFLFSVSRYNTVSIECNLLLLFRFCCSCYNYTVGDVFAAGKGAIVWWRHTTPFSPPSPYNVLRTRKTTWIPKMYVMAMCVCVYIHGACKQIHSKCN